MKSKYGRGIDMVDKSNRYINLGLLLLGIAALVLTQAASATQTYSSALNGVYGVSSCGICHINSSGEGPRNEYGTLFEKQVNHVSSPSAALVVIGAPPGLQTKTVIPTPGAAIHAPTVTVVSMPNVTTQAPAATVAKVTDKPIPVPTNKSPGIGTVAIIGIIGTIYVMRRKK